MNTSLSAFASQSSGGWSRRPLVLSMLSLALLPLAVPAQTSAVPTAPVQLRAAGASYALDGVVQAVKQATVSAQASGRIATLGVKAGDRVRAGQVLASIDDREAQVGVSRSQAQIQQADAELRNAQAQLERTRDLQRQGFLSKAALDTADTQFRAAQAQREQALASARQANISQGFTKVTAPFDGWVLQTFAEAGDLAVPGKPLVTVYAPQPLRAVVQVPASRTAAVRHAVDTSIAVLGPEGVSQRIVPASRLEVPSSDPVAQTSEWRFDLPAKEAAALVPGQQIRAVFSLGQGTSGQKLLIPTSAVVRRGELTAVYVASGQSFALRAVRLGQPQGTGDIEVLSGLGQNDVVATDPLKAANAGVNPSVK